MKSKQNNRKLVFLMNEESIVGTSKMLALAGEQKSNFSIFDNEKHLIYKGTATNEVEISKTLSLEEFPAGTYYLEVQDNAKTVKHEIVVKPSKTNKKTDETVNKSPAFRR